MRSSKSFVIAAPPRPYLVTGGKCERTAEAVGRDRRAGRERCKNDKLVKPRVTPVSAFSHKETYIKI